MHSTLKLYLTAQKATPHPILGQYGIPIQKFVQDFNQHTQHLEDDLVLSVKIHLFHKKITHLHFLPHKTLLLQKLTHEQSIHIQEVYLLALLFLEPHKFHDYPTLLAHLQSHIKTLLSSIQSYILILR